MASPELSRTVMESSARLPRSVVPSAALSWQRAGIHDMKPESKASRKIPTIRGCACELKERIGVTEEQLGRVVRGKNDVKKRFRNIPTRSEEHTSELQSRRDLVCRLLLEKKKK